MVKAHSSGINIATYLFLAASVLCTIASFLIHEIYSFDIWWQITIGTDILDQLAIPQVDRYTAAAIGRPYHDSHWLFQVALAGAHKAVGLIGVQLVMILVWGTTLWACYKACRRWVSQELALVLLFVAAMACIERFLPRPEIITFMMIAIFWLRLQNRQTYGTWNLLLLGLLQIIWANSHGLFVIGPFLVGCYYAETLLISRDRTEAGRLLKLLLLVIASTLATPYTFKGWQYAALLVTEASPAANETLKTLGELSPLFGSAARSAPAFWFFLALLVCTAAFLIIALAHKKVTPARTLILTGLLVATLTGRRNMVLFVLVAAPFTAEQLSYLPSIKVPRKNLLVTLTALTILAAAWFPLSGRYYLHMNQPARFGLGSTVSFFPHKLPAFLQAKGFKGQIFNSSYLGGFYLYHRFPHALPLTDGRWEIYDQDTLNKIKQAPASPFMWQKLLADYKIQGLLLAHGSPEAATLLPTLSGSSKWKLIYLDYAASFWARADQPIAITENPLLADNLPALPQRIEDCWLMNIFLDKVGAVELQLVNYKNALVFDWQTADWLTNKGQLELRLKKYPEAEETYAQILRLAPDNFSALNELAFLRYVRGDITSAEQLLLKAQEIEPDNKKTANNLRRVLNAKAKKR